MVRGNEWVPMLKVNFYHVTDDFEKTIVISGWDKKKNMTRIETTISIPWMKHTDEIFYHRGHKIF